MTVPTAEGAARRLRDRLVQGGTPPLPRRAWVEVDLGVLIWNVIILRSITGPDVLFAAVVKADAYGHGIEAAGLAARAAGAEYLSVATLDEALRLRHAGDTGRILVNYPLPADSLGEAAAADIEVPVGSERGVAALAALGSDAPEVHLEIDSGMTRGGVVPVTAADAARRLTDAGVPIRGVWSHLSTPEDAAITGQQVRAFEDGLASLRAAGVHPPLKHLCASGGVACGAPAYDLVRVGLAFYGVHPSPPDVELPAVARIQPALSVRAHATRVADVDAGTPVGYGGTWVASRSSRIATIPLGYADGWVRGAGPRTEVLVRGSRVPIVGRISSDSMMADVTDVRGVGEDDRFVLLGRDGGDAISADEIAEVRGTISWEVLQTLSRRLPRVYRLDGEVVAVRRYDHGQLIAVPDLERRLERAAGVATDEVGGVVAGGLGRRSQPT